MFDKAKKNQLKSLQTWFQEEILELCPLAQKKSLKYLVSKKPSNFCMQKTLYVITSNVLQRISKSLDCRGSDLIKFIIFTPLKLFVCVPTRI